MSRQARGNPPSTRPAREEGVATLSVATESASRALCRAVESSGLSGRQIADRCGVSEKTLREACDPHGPTVLTPQRMLLTPRTVFEAWQRELAHAYEELHGGRMSGSLETELHRLVHNALDAVRQTHDALRDGAIDATERRALRRMCTEIIAHASRVLALLDGEDEDGTDGGAGEGDAVARDVAPVTRISSARAGRR